MSSTLDYALNYLAHGWMPIPIQSRSKNPNRKGWQKERYTESDLPNLFTNGENIGLLNGEPSNGLVDVDLDWAEARIIGERILPRTEMIGGRASAPRSHYYYICSPLVNTAQFSDPDMPDGERAMIIELRSSGSQSLVAPSIHPGGEVYQWYGDLAPATVDGNMLREKVRKIAVCSLVARHWLKGQRHRAALAIAGTLLRSGWQKERVENFIRIVAIAAQDEELDDRINAVSTTAERIESDQEATGLPRLIELLGDKTVNCIQKWLSLDMTAFSDGKRTRQSNIGTNTPGDESIHTVPWPDPLRLEAFHGLAGDAVRIIDPHTESDSAALLGQFLTIFGNVAGRNAYFVAEADFHFMNLFCVLVGTTAKGRKGTSYNQVKTLFRSVDEDWARDRIQSGLSSGEGLIWAVRDAIEKTEPIRDKKQITGYRKVITDEGIEDKRLLAFEGEFASTLRVLGREGNTLSALVRQAWGCGDLRVLTKNSPAQATGAHISIIGHITGNELRRYLDTTEAGNGFANRFLWLCSRRSKSLPFGGRLQEVDLAPLIRRLAEAVSFGRSTGEIRRDDDANALWAEIYDDLSEGKPGLLGAVTSRAEAQVMRLACIYALLDCSRTIRREHLEAALALWRYCEDSARFIFGDSLGDPVADELLRALRQQSEGMTRTEIRDYFGRNRKAQEIARALSALSEQGLIYCQQEQTDGRPAERWFAITTKTTKTTKGGAFVVNVVNVVATGENKANEDWGEL